MFDDLNIDQPGLNYKVETTCFSSSYDNSTITTVSPAFHVHEYPKTGLLRQSGTMLTYKGPLAMIENLIESFDSSMGVLKCKGKSCPTSARVMRSVGAVESIAVDEDVDYPW